MKKTLTLLLTLALIFSFSACSKKPDGISGKVSPAAESTIGGITEDGFELIIPAGSFENAVNVSIAALDEGELTPENGASFLAAPLELSSDGGEHELGETVTLKIKLPDSVSEEDYLLLMGAYFDGESWDYILPDAEAIQNGYLQFGTPHFSRFAAVKLEKDKALDKYAETLAIQNVTSGLNQTDNTSLEQLSTCFSETLEQMGFTDKTAQGVIMQKLSKEAFSVTEDLFKHSKIYNVAANATVNFKNGDLADLSGQAAEIIAEAIVESMKEPNFVESLPNMVGSGTSGAVAAAVELYNGGSAGDAYKEFVYSAMDYFPAARAGKLAVEATKAGARMWQDYSVSSAYNVYLKQNISADGNVSADSWDMIFFNMGSGLDFMQREYRKAYAAASGKTLQEIEADRALRDLLDNQVTNDVKRSFMSRYKNTKAVEAEKARIKLILESFDHCNLLSWSTLRKYNADDPYAARLNALMNIRQSILDLAGGDPSVFGSYPEEIEANLASAIHEWLRFGKDRAKFLDWMREQGYLEKRAATGAGYWQLVRSFENDFVKSASDDYYVSSWSGGNGSYTYNCQFIGQHWYTGSTHDDC
ncbi:MAG: hypothetical protein PHR78_06540, partial [Eubacteriales bacterium]|nr:hypothetical protein [Eubacteriales bacterium]